MTPEIRLEIVKMLSAVGVQPFDLLVRAREIEAYVSGQSMASAIQASGTYTYTPPHGTCTTISNCGSSS